MNQDSQFASGTLSNRNFVKVVDDTRQQHAATILISQQDHTLGNIVRHQLLSNSHVRFAGYKKPHPLEERIEIKVHTDGAVKPEQADKDACG